MNPAWSNDQLNIKFAFSREGNVLTINLEAANQTLADEITDFVFQGTNLSLSIPVKSRPGPNAVLSFLIQDGISNRYFSCGTKTTSTTTSTAIKSSYFTRWHCDSNYSRKQSSKITTEDETSN